MTFPSLTRRGFAAVLAACCLPACGSPMRESRRRIQVLVAGAPASSYDRLARVVVPPVEARLGNARLQMLLRPTAGGRLMAKTLTEGTPDGSLIGFLPSGLIYAEMLNEPGVAFELRRFRWLASATAERRVLLLATRLGIRTVEDLLAYDRPLNVSANAVGSPTWVSPLFLNAILGTRLRPIPGYPGPARDAAVLSGEVDGVLATATAGAGLMAAAETTPIVRLSPGPAPQSIAGIPVLRTLSRSPHWHPLLDLIETHDDFGRAIAAPPGTSDEHLQPLREAFEAALTDPLVVASAANANMAITLTPGVDVEGRVESLFSESGATRRLLDEAVSCGLGRARGMSC